MVEINGRPGPRIADAVTTETTPPPVAAGETAAVGAPDQVALGGTPVSPDGRVGSAGTEALGAAIAPGPGSVPGDVLERSLEVMEFRNGMVASARGVEGPSPNDTGDVGSAAELAQVVYAGYNGGSPGPISIVPVEVSGADGFQPGNTYLVTISGTEFVEGQATGIGTDANAGFNRNNRLLESVIEAIDASGIPDGADIIFAGHSLGGMVAQQAAANRGLKDRFNIQNTVAFGSPLLAAGRREGEVRRIADRGDPVPGMSAEAVFMPWWNHPGGQRRGGGVNPMRAHVDSYVNENLWEGVDVLGRNNGSATIRFNPADRMFFSAPTRGPDSFEFDSRPESQPLV